MLVWTLLSSTVTTSLSSFTIKTIDVSRHLSTPTDWLILMTPILTFLLAPLSGWLADVKLGYYKVFKAGTLLLFTSTIINCLRLILKAEVESSVINGILSCSGCILLILGSFAWMITLLPLGLDQMPDASALNITSLIAWLVGSAFIGAVTSKVLDQIRESCLAQGTESNYSLIWAWCLTLCMIVVLISNIFCPKWLIIEPKSPQSLNTIYKVLKFAVKHKAPLNRSALTYWEEDIPSRIDLGKSKYGGPFTTEQVEDVKTVLRLMVISVPFALVAFSFCLQIAIKSEPSGAFPALSVCKTKIVYIYSPTIMNGVLF